MIRKVFQNLILNLKRYEFINFFALIFFLFLLILNNKKILDLRKKNKKKRNFMQYTLR